MTDTHAASAHASHDTILVASLADHSLPSSRARRCRSARRRMQPRAPTSTPTSSRSAPRPGRCRRPARPRDYTLTHADAARLRPGGWRRFVAAFGTSRDALQPAARGRADHARSRRASSWRPSRPCCRAGSAWAVPRPHSASRTVPRRRRSNAEIGDRMPSLAAARRRPSRRHASEPPAPGIRTRRRSPAAVRPASSGDPGFRGGSQDGQPRERGHHVRIDEGVRAARPARAADDGPRAGSTELAAGRRAVSRR